MWSVDFTENWQVWMSRIKVLQKMISVKQGNAETCQHVKALQVQGEKVWISKVKVLQ